MSALRQFVRLSVGRPEHIRVRHPAIRGAGGLLVPIVEVRRFYERMVVLPHGAARRAQAISYIRRYCTPSPVNQWLGHYADRVAQAPDTVQNAIATALVDDAAARIRAHQASSTPDTPARKAHG